jgi:thiamine biosynthesis protein ThiI
VIHVTLSGDIFLKSRRTQPRMVKRVLANLEAALHSVGFDGKIRRIGGHRFTFDPAGQQERLAEAATGVFGIASVDSVVEIPIVDIDSLAADVAARSADRVAGRTFAVRVKRRGTHTWNSMDLASRAGELLVAAGGRVNLDDPQETVAVTVLDDRAFLIQEHRAGPAGLPIGTQEPVLTLVSGGFDSVVAAWMMMSRGCPVEFVHFTLDCAQSEHAIAVVHALSEKWGHGVDPTVHVVEFQPVKDALIEGVDSRMRQVALKVLMAQAAAAIARERRISALVTGDALGQVSSQTLPHLVAVSKAVETPILRPLVGLPKQIIIDYARRVGTAEISARAREVCDLSGGGPVATAAREGAIRRSVDQVPEALMLDAVATRKTFLVGDWMPGGI